jgi:hypothetical protein
MDLWGGKMEVADRFAQVRRDLLEKVSSFPGDKSGQAVCGQWDIKCVLAHIAGWDAYFTMIVRLLRNGKDVPYRGDNIEKWNAAMVKEREGRTWNEVRDEFVKASEELLKEYSKLEGESWSRRFWEQRDPTPAWVVKYNAENYQEHLAEIEKKMREWEGNNGWMPTQAEMTAVHRRP